MKKYLYLILFFLVCVPAIAAPINSYTLKSPPDDADTIVIYDSADGSTKKIEVGDIDGWSSSGGSIYVTTTTDNIGIGTFSALARIDISGSNATMLFKDNENTANNKRWVIGAYDNGFANSTNFGIQSTTNNGTTASPDFFMFPDFGVGIGTFSIDGKITIMGDGTGTGIVLNTKNSSGTSLVTMLDNGNVGISSVNPTARLSILGTGTGTGSTLNLRDSAGTLRTTFLDNGNIGIGSTSPGAKIDIFSGTIRAIGIGTTVPQQLCRKSDGSFGYFDGVWAGTCN